MMPAMLAVSVAVRGRGLRGNGHIHLIKQYSSASALDLITVIKGRQPTDPIAVAVRNFMKFTAGCHDMLVLDLRHLLKSAHANGVRHHPHAHAGFVE